MVIGGTGELGSFDLPEEWLDDEENEEMRERMQSLLKFAAPKSKAAN